MNDDVLKFLLKDYRRPELESEKKQQLKNTLHERSEELRSNSSASVAWAAVKFSMAAAAALIIIAGSFFLFLITAPLGNPYTVADSGTASRDKGGLISAPADEELKVITSGEEIILSPGTEMKISGSLLRRLNGDSVNTYEIASGDVYIRHSSGSFNLKTGFALISPVGTVLSCSVSEDLVSVICMEGLLLAAADDGSEYYIREGERLTAVRNGEMWTVEITPEEGNAEGVFIPAEYASVPETLQADEQPSDEDPQSGFRKIWTTDFNSASIKGISAQSLYGGRMFLYDGDIVAAADAETGRIAVSLKTPSDYNQALFYEDKLIGLNGNSIEVVDSGSGEILWTAEAGPIAFGSPAAAEGKIYYPSADGRMYIFDSESGADAGSFDAGAGMYGTPLVFGDSLVYSTLERKLVKRDLKGNKILWEFTSNGRFTADKPVISGVSDIIADFTDGGIILLLDSLSGKLLREITVLGSLIAGPVFVDNMLIFEDEAGINILKDPAGGKTEISDTETPAASGLYAAGKSGGHPVIISASGLSVPDAPEFDIPRSDIAAGWINGKSILLETENGKLELWRLTE